MRHRGGALLVLWLLSLLGGSAMAFGYGLYAMAANAFPVPYLKYIRHHGQIDPFGRLLRYPDKIAIGCPPQDDHTAVLLLLGQSNAANYQGQRYQSPDNQVLNFSDGACYRAGSPLLGADGDKGESWTLLGRKLIDAGLYHTVILIPAAIGGSVVRRWAEGGDLHAMLDDTVRTSKLLYTVTAVLWDQGNTDFNQHTTEAAYRRDLGGLIAGLRRAGITAPVFISRCSLGHPDWTEDNPVARAQASLLDDRQAIFAGPNTDRDITKRDRYDDSHFGASGQEIFAEGWVRALRAHRGE